MVRFGRFVAWMFLAVTCAGLYWWSRPVTASFEPFHCALPNSSTPLGLATDGAGPFVSTQAHNNHPGRILKIGEDGTSALTLLDAGLTYPLGLSVHGDELYVTDCQSGPVTDTQIFRGPKDGSAPLTPIYTGSKVGEPIVDGSGIVFENGSLYTTDMVQGRVHRLNSDGSGLTELGHVFPLRAPDDRFWGSHRTTIAADRGMLYFADAGDSRVHVPPHVRAMSVSGGAFKTLWTGAPFVAPASIAIYNGSVYVADPGVQTVWKLLLSGGRPEAFATGHPTSPDCGIVALHGSLYLADSPAFGQPGEIYRAPLGGAPSSHIPFLAISVGAPITLIAGLRWSPSLRRFVRRLLKRAIE